ncbi:ABC transporter permease [Enterococcus lemanii]|jgi:putative hydroxymethylpyrimidine transport system permease protein|uniref:ABC transporter permease n=1 Tax=Enterococcus lemanii TaxID=1159752 RepID=A0ABV9MRV7_9ENTE|nr:ABC transporter permease [Enterococcus lemanii]NLM66508.1 ABC transporter permease [Enterococcus sp.]
MKNHKISSFLPFVVTSLSLLLLVEGLVRLGAVPDFIIPSPTNVLAFLWQSDRTLFTQHLRVTLWETMLGFFFAFVMGCVLAICMYQSPIFEKIFYPFALFSQTIPTIALAPIFILWFGYSIWSKVALSCLIAFFPITIGLFDGLKSTPQEALELFDSLGASKWQRLRHLSLPHALPQLLSNIKLAIIYALVGASIGEWMGASEGLGYYSRRMSGNLNANGVFAAISLLSLLGMVLFLFVSLFERYLLPWNQEAKKKGK